MFENQYIEYTLPAQKNIALIAHDNKKHDIIEWCKKNKSILERHFLCGTGTTAKMIADGKIDLIIFFSDPLTAQPHDPDVKALLRIAQVYDIPIANNVATADFIVTSPYMNSEYTHKLLNFRQHIEDRAKNL